MWLPRLLLPIETLTKACQQRTDHYIFSFPMLSSKVEVGCSCSMLQHTFSLCLMFCFKGRCANSSSTTSKGFTCVGGPLLKVLNRAQQRTQPSVTYTFIPCLYFCAFSQLKHMQWTCLSSNRGSISNLPLVFVHFTARLQTNITLSACFRSNYSRYP